MITTSSTVKRAYFFEADSEKMDALTAEAKISFAMQKANARLMRFQKVMVSLSGGADSDVMLDLLLRVCPKEKMRFVFFDTGLEFDATKRHLAVLEQKYEITIERIRADVPVPLGVKQYGLPFISKDISTKIGTLQHNGFDFERDGMKPFQELAEIYPRCKAALAWWCNAKSAEHRHYTISQTAYLKEFMIAHPPTFKISDMCCRGAKKQPSHKYEKEGGFDCKCLGLRRAEGGVRATVYKNCYTFDPKANCQSMRPIWWFTDQDKKTYIDTYGLQLSDCYTLYGLKRTGCAGCPFNSRFEEDLKVLSEFEPKLYRAVNAVFGAAYEYTRMYRAFKASAREKKRRGGQMSLFDHFED